MKNGIIAGVAVLMMAGAVQAETYICSLKAEGRDTGWISKTIGFTIDDRTQEVLVSDSVILQAYKKPIPAKLVLNTPKRITIRWVVSGEKDVRNVTYSKFLYRLTVFKAIGNKVAVKANPSGSYRSLGASGRCELRK